MTIQTVQQLKERVKIFKILTRYFWLKNILLFEPCIEEHMPSYSGQRAISPTSSLIR